MSLLTKELLRTIYNILLITWTSLFDEETAAREIREYVIALAKALSGVSEEDINED